MSFIETHIIEPEQAKPVIAVKEAFTALKDGGQYTLKITAFLGLVLGVLFWAEERFDINGIGGAVAQTLVEAIFIYYWHRFFLLEEAELTNSDYTPFVKRTLFYYLVLALTAIMLAFVFIALVGGLSDTGTVALILAGTVAALFVVLRIVLVFPAIAVGSDARAMADAFVLSSGNATRLAAGYFLMLLIVLLAFFPAFIVLGYAEFSAPEMFANEGFILVSNLIIGFTAAVSTLLWAGVNSSFYRQLGGDIPASASDETGIFE